MATLTVASTDYARPYRDVRLAYFPEAASQTFIKGDLLILQTTTDKGNQVKIASADPTTDRAIVGFAAGAASGTADTLIPVWLATPEAEFLIRCQDGGVLDNDDVSVQYGIVKDSTNLIWRLDRSETTAKVFTVLRLIDTHADVNGRYVVKFIASEILHG
jgi:hypothetical protein